MDLASSLRTHAKNKGYLVFEDGDYNLNIFGIRSAETRAGRFDDRIVVSYKQGGVWHTHSFLITTDPGRYWLENPLKKLGTAILKEGQYRSSWKLGLHKGRYRALVQCKPVIVYRDSNRDGILDRGILDKGMNEERGLFGINIHRAGSKRKSIQVGRWSAGCQVFSDPVEYDFFLSLCREQKSRYGNRFTYTLFDGSELGLLKEVMK